VRIYRFEEDLDQLRQTDPFPWRDLAARGCRNSCRIAAVKSPAPRTGGKASGTTRSRREGMRRSRHGRNTAVSPPRASSTALRPKASASPSSANRTAIVEPFLGLRGRPAGFARLALYKGATPLLLLHLQGIISSH